MTQFQELKGGMKKAAKQTMAEKEKFSPPLIERGKADAIAEAIANEVRIYRLMLEGTLPATEKTKKATQTAIKELCAALQDYISDPDHA